ncbi:hypothetical protein CEQ90_17695 [Lewinellaceae bacterium SD302]|nr:hypothetical protein CEQ90_17695 [Lewinellaceae bacterium SD302]
MKKFPFFLLVLLALVGCDTTSSPSAESSQTPITDPTNELTLSSDIEWTPLNAARGDASPQAGTIWGDRNEKVTTGFLVKFKEGFSSPPHIHNITYRGTVIKGLIHNDDPGAANMWMPAGSFWTQPAGEPHITSAKAEENMAYIEIDHGPYLVMPTDEAFDEGERPVNLDAGNIVWVNATDDGNPAQIAYLWGDPQNGEAYGTHVKIPAGFSGWIESEGSVFRAIVISGELNYTLPEADQPTNLDIGSSFSSSAMARHTLAANVETILYVRSNGPFDFFKQ